jgi:xanthine dehydrogenase accessory factor
MPQIYRQLWQRLKEGKESILITSLDGDKLTRTLHDGRTAPPPREDGADPAGEKAAPASGTLVERFLPRERLIIFGCGHIAVPLAKIAALLRFEVTVFDDRLSFANRRRFPEAGEIICDYFDNAPQRLKISAQDYVVIVTRGHKHDQTCLRHVLRGELPYYLGMIGSKRRVGIVRGQLLQEGCAPEALRRLHSPIGLPIGALIPEEIALSIAAEIIREKRLGAQRSSFAGQEALDAHPDMELLEWLAGPENEPAALVTVLATKGSTPREAGARMALCSDGRAIGSIGGGCAEAAVLQEARAVLLNGGYRLKTVDLTDKAEEDGMVCGGVMKVLIEAVRKG